MRGCEGRLMKAGEGKIAFLLRALSGVPICSILGMSIREILIFVLIN